MSRILATLRRRLRRSPPLVSTGNSIELVIDGDAYFEGLWADIDAATRAVWLEVYMLVPDAVGMATLERLEHAAVRGCDVVLVYDHLGSGGLAERHLGALRAAGARTHSFNPVWPWAAHGPLLFRDHRKLALIDGRIAWLGGRNIGAHYAGIRLGRTPFRDTQARVTGPAVAQLAATLAETLEEIGAPPLPALPAPPPTGTVRLEVLSANAFRQQRALQTRLRQATAAARRLCWFTTPYPVMSRRLMRQLRRRARAGVDVRVLLPARSDVRLVDLARGFCLRKLAHAGVRLYLYREPLHAKTLVIDDSFGEVGSFNMDAFTSLNNLELGLAVYDDAVAGTLQAQFLDDLTRAIELDPLAHLHPLVRAVEWCAFALLTLRPPWNTARASLLRTAPSN